MTAATDSNVADPLEFMAAKCLADPGGELELCYTPAFARAMADAYESGSPERTLAAGAICRKLKKRFGSEFNSNHFRDAIKIYRPEARAKYQEAKKPRPVTPTEGVDLRNFTLTDDGNADRLIAMHGPNLKYCGATNAWMIWDGRRWQPDDSFRIQLLVTSTMKELASQSENDQAIWEHAQQSMSARGIDATIKLARAKCPADAKACFRHEPLAPEFPERDI